MSLLSDLDALDAQMAADALDTPEAAEAFRVRYLGRKAGALTDLFKRLPELPAEDRRAVGARLNALREQAEARVAEAEAALNAAEKAAQPGLDLSLPGRRPVPGAGSRHVLTQTLDEILRVFGRLGFAVAEGPELETDFFNFTALGFPPDHPARDMQDTFFVAEDKSLLLRTHTSPVQIRTMIADGVPLRIVAPGRVYRNEDITYKSYNLFHQVEGLYVDEGVTFADLKAVLRLFAEAMFGSDVKMRFRPSFFPFTEPSAEVDIWSDALGGRWLEILGCGMVDPVLFAHTGVDAERYTGYAFGMGVERIAMLRHGIEDIRLLYENDVRLLEQFG
ncbi:MAG: phenylalanine--tRNA ligase subunit alpha [Rhodothermales bacterium]|nr:phenylalanine--tRNA ligase subunit alpha [Rhodothermales bacterium]MCA0268533.1 phenylalanine--tRNA ligase subunit alpha [Bacteroidota bacterium]